MRKAIILLPISVVALVLLPASYACWTGRWHVVAKPVYCQPECGVIFTCVYASDNEGKEDVAQIDAWVEDSGGKIVTTMTNAYPGYQGYVAFTVKNVGRVPVKITDVTIDNPNPGEVPVRIAEPWLVWGVLHPGSCLSWRLGLLVYGVTEEVAMNAAYTFTITIHAEQWNYH